MREQPQLTSLDLWGEHEQLCNDLIRAALKELASQPVDRQENDLNRDLYFALIRASQKIARHRGPLATPVYEGRNPPDPSDEERAEREFKIPDFQWGYVDHLANDIDIAARYFVVECKRLTSQTSLSERRYVECGVNRFISPAHGYGKGAGEWRDGGLPSTHPH